MAKKKNLSWLEHDTLERMKDIVGMAKSVVMPNKKVTEKKYEGPSLRSLSNLSCRSLKGKDKTKCIELKEKYKKGLSSK
jgi:hypothetical protein